MQIQEYDSSKIELIKNNICKNASDDELELFIMQCKRTGLDPFAKQIYSIARGDTRTIQISIDGARLIAERSGKYVGQVGPFWCGPDGVWSDVWLKNEYPVAAKIGVLRSDFKEPLFAVANFNSYNANNIFWKRFPALMISKCSEALALRRAFPQELSGLYVEDELAHADKNDTKETEDDEETKNNNKSKSKKSTVKTIEVKTVNLDRSELDIKGEFPHDDDYDTLNLMKNKHRDLVKQAIVDLKIDRQLLIETKQKLEDFLNSQTIKTKYTIVRDKVDEFYKGVNK